MDINCDLGEGMGSEIAILPFIQSANIACGLHAGSATEMVRTVALAKKNGVKVGAHPSWDDRPNFGRTAQDLPADEIESLVLYQLGALDAICRQQHWPLVHVKPHGALYNQASTDPVIAEAIVRAIQAFNPGLQLFALCNSLLAKKGKEANLVVKEEAFADRRYTPEGLLAPRSHPQALITDTQGVLEQVQLIVYHQTVRTTEGTMLPIIADTICIHGDGPTAGELATAIHYLLHQLPKA